MAEAVPPEVSLRRCRVQRAEGREGERERERFTSLSLSGNLETQRSWLNSLAATVTVHNIV